MQGITGSAHPATSASTVELPSFRYVAKHSKTTSADDKRDAMTLVRIRDGSMGNISADRLKFCLGKHTLGSGIGK
jgi:hypothetical protein